MIKGLLKDFRILTIAGIPIFFAGFIIACPLMSIIGASMSATGLTFYTVVDQELKKKSL